MHELLHQLINGVCLKCYYESHNPYLIVEESFPDLTWTVSAGEICCMGGPRGALSSHYCRILAVQNWNLIWNRWHSRCYIKWSWNQYWPKTKQSVKCRCNNVWHSLYEKNTDDRKDSNQIIWLVLQHTRNIHTILTFLYIIWLELLITNIHNS